MILQALKEYYDRKFSEGQMPPLGFEIKEIPFLIVIDAQGNFISLEDTREPEGKRMVGKKFQVPSSEIRSGSKSYMTTNLLWDHIGYVLGIPKGDGPEERELAKNQHAAWIESIENLPAEIKEAPEIRAMISFYENNGIENVLKSEEIEDCKKIPGCNIAFRLNSELSPVPSGDLLKRYRKFQMESTDEKGENVIGYDLVTGEIGQIVRLHRKTPINKDADSLVSFQKNSGYDSYGKEQGYNSPVTKDTEFAYTTALNYLLKSEKRRMQVGDSHTVFWGGKENKLEERFSVLFEEPESTDHDKDISPVRELFNSIKSGAYIGEDRDVPFYVLGLSPNSARISIRFWENGKVGEYSERIKQYFDDFSIVKNANNQEEPDFYPLQRILANISTLDKFENIPPSLAGNVMRAILKGTLYPASMLQLAVRRIRNDTINRVTRVRAATIKAYLNRYGEFYSNNKMKEITMKLDKTQPSAGYQLGRLFAALERIQEKANPNLNATIRERYYGSACTSPITVFPTLLRLKNHHLAKIENKGIVTMFEKELGEIIGNVEFFPSHLDLHGQGMFAIGYYHQRQDFFTKKEEKPEVET